MYIYENVNTLLSLIRIPKFLGDSAVGKEQIQCKCRLHAPGVRFRRVEKTAQFEMLNQEHLDYTFLCDFGAYGPGVRDFACSVNRYMIT